MDSWINGVGLALARSLGLMLANFSFGIAWSKFFFFFFKQLMAQLVAG